jgi:predicted nucleotidyltransferase
MKALDQIALSPADRKAVEAAAAILRRQFPVSRVTLFGSKARGEDHPEADIDLLAVTGRPLTAPE